jgi:predicted transcriptional regulator
MALVTFRLDDKLERELRRLAEMEGKTKTDLVREALADYTARKKSAKRPVSVAEAMKDYIGSGRSKNRDLSLNTGKKFLEILLEKKKKRRL